VSGGCAAFLRVRAVPISSSSGSRCLFLEQLSGSDFNLESSSVIVVPVFVFVCVALLISGLASDDGNGHDETLFIGYCDSNQRMLLWKRLRAAAMAMGEYENEDNPFIGLLFDEL